MAPRRTALVTWVVLVFFVAPATAHEVSTTRFDAPIPIELLYLGTGLTLAVTAGYLVVTAREDTRVRRTGRHPIVSPRTGAILRRVVRYTFLAVVIAAVYRGLVGQQAPGENVATVFVWALWLEGVALVAAVFGSPWRVLSPWRTLYEWLNGLEGEDVAVLGTYPSRLGTWPAVAFFLLGVGIVENLTLIPRSPRATAAAVAGYALCMLVGALLFGSEWFAKADALDVLYRLFARVAPLRIARTDAGGYALEVRTPWVGCTDSVADVSTAAFAIVALYTVTFDGFTDAPEFRTLLAAARDLGFATSDAAVLGYIAGAALFLVVFGAVAAWTARLSGARPGGYADALTALAPTLLPIAVAYEIAHYYPFVAENLGLAVELAAASAAGAQISVSPLWWLSLPAFWVSQVALIVGGHVVAVVAVHYVLVGRSPPERLARATLPMTLLMIGYTVLSLWIISRPVLN